MDGSGEQLDELEGWMIVLTRGLHLGVLVLKTGKIGVLS
jgi:hypothetical protein